MLIEPQSLAAKATRVSASAFRVYGCARSLLALSTLCTIAFNSAQVLFPRRSAECIGAEALSLFCRVPETLLEPSRWIAVGVLASVLVGWLPRVTGVLHWWIAFSFAVSSTTIDGGDQLAANIALLLIPVTLVDKRPWHWEDARSFLAMENLSSSVIAAAGLILIRFQMAFVYLEAVVGKLYLRQEWREGSALFYWLGDPTYGLSQSATALLSPILSHPWAVKCATWTVVLVEIALVAALLARGRLRPIILLLGLATHGLIALFLGLPTFSMTMIAGLLLYLPPKWSLVAERSSAHSPALGNQVPQGATQSLAPPFARQ